MVKASPRINIVVLTVYGQDTIWRFGMIVRPARFLTRDHERAEVTGAGKVSSARS